MNDLTIENALNLLNAYRAEVKNQRKNLDALLFLCKLVEDWLFDNMSESDYYEKVAEQN